MIIPVITLYQPWASFIMLGWKTIETRTHNRFKCLNFNTIGIHASKHYDPTDCFVKYLSDEQLESIKDIKFPTGALLGTVFVDDTNKLNESHSKKALIECGYEDKYGLFVSDPRNFGEPIKMIGSMGIWYYDTETKQKVKKPRDIPAAPTNQIGIGYEDLPF